MGAFLLLALKTQPPPQIWASHFGGGQEYKGSGLLVLDGFFSDAALLELPGILVGGEGWGHLGGRGVLFLCVCLFVCVCF